MATGDLKLGVMLGYWAAQPRHHEDVPIAQEAERLGYDSVWTAEAYGSDAATPLAWLGAHTKRIRLGTGLIQMSARTPAMTAMTAATLDHLTEGRLILGLGVSGPQVVEGWYGQPFAKPLARTREYVGIVRDILRREGPVTSDGPHYPLPLPADAPGFAADGNGALGIGKPLKITTHPRRADVPIYLGAEGPRNVALAAEIADGWLPIFLSPERLDAMYGQSLAGAKPDFDIAAPVMVSQGETVEQAIQIVKWMLGFYIGGMGAEKANFHRDVIGRAGFAEEAQQVQKLFLEGDKMAAVNAVPDALCDEIALVGPPGRIKERLQRWVDSPISSLLVMSRDPANLRLIAESLG